MAKGKLVLGQFQAIIAAELDGPRNRDLAVQIIGTLAGVAGRGPGTAPP